MNNRLLAKGLLFESNAPYVNPAFFDPKRLVVQPGKQLLLLNGEAAVFVMVGMGAACELVNAATQSSKSKTQLVRQIGFIPQEQHWLLLASALGQKYSFKDARANMDGSMLFLSTRPEAKVEEDEKGALTIFATLYFLFNLTLSLDDIVKASDLADVLMQSPSSSRKKSVKPKSGFNSVHKYPSSRSFEDGRELGCVFTV